MFGLGIWEIAIVLVLALLVLGPEKLPKVAKQLGRLTSELKRTARDFRSSMESAAHEADLHELRRDSTAGKDGKAADDAQATPKPTPAAHAKPRPELADSAADVDANSTAENEQSEDS